MSLPIKVDKYRFINQIILFRNIMSSVGPYRFRPTCLAVLLSQLIMFYCAFMVLFSSMTIGQNSVSGGLKK